MKIECPCGTVFEGRAGRSKYCSNACKYKHRKRPSGLKYEIRQVNPAWFKQGRDAAVGEAHPNWKGDEVGYRQLHDWVRANRNKTGCCENCSFEGNTEWANKSHEYKRQLDDWLELCRKCHRKHDSGPNWGRGSQRFGYPYGKVQSA